MRQYLLVAHPVDGGAIDETHGAILTARHHIHSLAPAEEMGRLHLEILVESDEARSLGRFVRTVKPYVDVGAVSCDVLRTADMLVAGIDNERLAQRGERLGIIFADPESAARDRRLGDRAHPDVYDTVQAGDAVAAMVRPRHLAGEREVLVILLDGALDLWIALRRLPSAAHGDHRVEMAVPPADVARVFLGIDALQGAPVPVRLENLVVEGKVKRIGGDAHALHVSAPRVTYHFLHRPRLREPGVPAGHLPRADGQGSKGRQ